MGLLEGEIAVIWALQGEEPELKNDGILVLLERSQEAFLGLELLWGC